MKELAMQRVEPAGTVPAIAVDNVTVRYGKVVALSGATCTIPARGVHGILGPNGAGKSSLIHLLTGLATPTSGTVTYGGGMLDTGFRVGYQPEEPALYDFLTTSEFLELAMHVAGTTDAAFAQHLLERFELDESASRHVRELSAGSRRKLAIVAALVQRPRLVVLDEPTNGLDARAVLRLKEEIHRLRSEGVPVVLSTHIFDFAATLCDSVTILSRGRVVYDGTVQGLPSYDGPPSFEANVARMMDL